MCCHTFYGAQLDAGQYYVGGTVGQQHDSVDKNLTHVHRTP